MFQGLDVEAQSGRYRRDILVIEAFHYRRFAGIIQSTETESRKLENEHRGSPFESNQLLCNRNFAVAPECELRITVAQP